MQSATKSNVTELKPRKKMKKTSPEDMVSAEALVQHQKNTGKMWSEISRDLDEKANNISNWRTRNRMPKRVLKKLEKIEGRPISAKEVKVRQHTRKIGPVAEDAKTLYLIKVPGDQDKTVKSVLNALGCSYRKVDI